MGFFGKRAAVPQEPLEVPLSEDFAELQSLSNIKKLIDQPEKSSGKDYGSHLIVFANEKGGVGKSTTAFHTTIALCHLGESVAVLDLDERQQSLAGTLRKRVEMSRHLEIEFPMPEFVTIHQNNEASLDEMLRVQRRKSKFVIIDLAGHDSPVARHTIQMANTLITPINDSFVDIEVLGHINPTDLKFQVLAPFSRLVETARQRRISSLRGPLEWVVIQNRLRTLYTKNAQKFNDVLQEISDAANFRLGSGLQERVIYRELIPLGLTLLDLPLIPEMSTANPEAEAELKLMIDTLKLPLEAQNGKSEPLGVAGTA